MSGRSRRGGFPKRDDSTRHDQVGPLRISGFIIVIIIFIYLIRWHVIYANLLELASLLQRKNIPALFSNEFLLVN